MDFIHSEYVFIQVLPFHVFVWIFHEFEYYSELTLIVEVIVHVKYFELKVIDAFCAAIRILICTFSFIEKTN